MSTKCVNNNNNNKFKFNHTNKWYKHNPESILENSLGFWDTNGSPNSARRPDLVIVNKRKRTYQVGNFAIPADHRVKLKESKKKDKYIDLSRELKKLWNMTVTLIPIVICTLGSATKELIIVLDLEIRGRVKNDSIIKIGQNIEKSSEEACCHSNSSGRLVWKTFKWVIMIAKSLKKHKCWIKKTLKQRFNFFKKNNSRKN